jgi:hypothetical protein
MLDQVKALFSWLSCVLVAGAGCAVANGGSLGAGGSGVERVTEQSSYTLSCGIDPLVLDLGIELVYEMDRPNVEGEPSDLTFSAAVIFDEAAASALVDAGTPKIDIISMQVTSSLQGGTPSRLETSLSAAPINDFDLEVDTDDNGAPGPHRLELKSVTTAVSIDDDATEVELGLGLDGVFFIMGDFEVPDDCLSPTLVGFAARFPVDSSR